MFAPVTQLISHPFGEWFAPVTEARHTVGFSVEGLDPYWGSATFVYVKAESTMEKGSLVRISSLGVAADCPNTANLGAPVFVLMSSMISGQYGWAMRKGLAIISATASIAADAAVGITAAGQVGANTAGKQILNARVQLPGTTTVVKTNVNTRGGSAKIMTSGYDGWHLGMALTGTGIPASTVIAAMDPDGRSVLMGSVIGTVDKLATASGAVSVTGTMTGYLGVLIDDPFAQGAIT